MCRGCIVRREGEPTTDEYLSWLGTYHGITADMKRLEKELLKYQASIDSKKQKRTLDTFRRSLIYLRREYARADAVLNELYKN